jgi:DNA-binding transcriptional LysR family regulator
MRGMRKIRSDVGGQIQRLAAVGVDLLRIDQAIAANPHAVVRIRQIRQHVAAKIIGHDDLGKPCIEIARFRTGSLSAAARQLKTPLATVSRKVSELESHLRTKLFNRSSRKLVLTDAGSSYFAACKRILADVTEAERAASGEYSAPTGELIITAPVGLGRAYLIPILADFLKAYPDIKASLLLADRVQSLFQEQIDVGLRIGALPDSSLIAVRLGTTRRMACASPAYLAAHGTPRTPDELAGHDCISYAGFISPDVWTFFKDNTAVAVPARARLVVGSAEAACDAVCAGIGLPDRPQARSSHDPAR